MGNLKHPKLTLSRSLVVFTRGQYFSGNPNRTAQKDCISAASSDCTRNMQKSKTSTCVELQWSKGDLLKKTSGVVAMRLAAMCRVVYLCYCRTQLLLEVVATLVGVRIYLLTTRVRYDSVQLLACFTRG
jgi:hypothetical protein